MADALIAFRKTDRLTQRCVQFSMAASGPCGDHKGDPIQVFPAATLWTLSDNTRTSHAWVLITDIPPAVAQLAKKWVHKGTIIGEAVDRPKILNLDKDLLKAQYPGQESNIEKLFEVGRTQTISSIENFAIPWSKAKAAIKNKLLSRVMTDEEWETDPNAA